MRTNSAAARKTRRQRLDTMLPSRLDASETAFLLRQLEFIATRTYDVVYPNLYARRYVPVNNSVDPGASTYTYAQFSQVGTAKLLASYADDLPRADVFSKEFSSAIKPIGNSYGYNIQELRAAARANVALDQKKSNAARRGVENEIDRILSVGDSAAGLNGIINQANALLFVVPNGGGGTPDWASKTAIEILHDMVNICAFIPNSTEQVEMPDTLLMPPDQYTIISTTPYGIATDLTVLEYFNRNKKGIEVGVWPRLKGAGAGGTDRMIAYERNPDKVEGIIPQEFEQLPPQPEGLSYQIACHARVGGVIAYYPLSIAYGDGI